MRAAAPRIETQSHFPQTGRFCSPAAWVLTMAGTCLCCVRAPVKPTAAPEGTVRERTASLANVDQELGKLVCCLKGRSTELEAARCRGEAAARAKRKIPADIRHGIGAPTNAVPGVTGLATNSELTPVRREHLTTVRTPAEGLRALLNQVAEFSRLEAGGGQLQSARFELRCLFRESVRTLLLET